MPAWNHLHPLLVHFPIALLLFAPVPALLGLVWPAQRQGLHAAALAALVGGVLSGLAALVTGDAASGLAQRTPALRLTLAAHARWATVTVEGFALLTLLFALLWLMPMVAPGACSRRSLTVLHALWLLLCLAPMASLVRTGHLGGHMVHDLGTHALPPKETP